MNTFNRKEALDILKKMKRMISSKPTLPILNYVHAIADGQQLRLESYNMEMGGYVTAAIPFTGDSFDELFRLDSLVKVLDGVSHPSLSLTINHLRGEMEPEPEPEPAAPAEETPVEASSELPPADETPVENAASDEAAESKPAEYTPVRRYYTESEFILSSGKFSFVGPTKAGSEYPKCAFDGPELMRVKVGFKTFDEEARFVLVATNKEMPRNFTSGVLFNWTSDKITIVGTDGRRLHATPLPYFDLSVAQEGTMLVPVAAIDYLLKVGFAKTADIEFRVLGEADGDMRLFWECCGISGYFHLMDTPYPDWEKVIPETTNQFAINAGAVIAALKPIKIVASEHDGRDMAIVATGNGSMSIETVKTCIGQAKEAVDIRRVCGENEIRFALNAFYFEEALKNSVTPCGETFISCEGELDPIRFDFDGSSRIAVVMPVRLPE